MKSDSNMIKLFRLTLTIIRNTNSVLLTSKETRLITKQAWSVPPTAELWIKSLSVELLLTVPCIHHCTVKVRSLSQLLWVPSRVKLLIENSFSTSSRVWIKWIVKLVTWFIASIGCQNYTLIWWSCFALLCLLVLLNLLLWCSSHFL